MIISKVSFFSDKKVLITTPNKFFCYIIIFIILIIIIIIININYIYIYILVFIYYYIYIYIYLNINSCVLFVCMRYMLLSFKRFEEEER